MKISTKKRLLLGGAVSALAVAPFIIRNFRKTTQLPEGHVATFPATRDPSIVPSGKVDVVNDYITFEPLTLPSDDVHSWTLNAALSNDNKWLFVSYCSGSDCQAKICYAPLDRSGLPESFVELEKFGSQSAVVGMGCSSLSSRGSSQLSYRLRKHGVDVCKDSISCVSLRQRGVRLEQLPDPVLLSESEFSAKELVLFGIGKSNHCWLNERNAFVFPNMSGVLLLMANCEKSSNERISTLRKLFNETDGEAKDHRVITSNLHIEYNTIKFLEAPRTIGGQGKLDPLVDPYRTDTGLLVSIGLDGIAKSEKMFPVPSRNRKTLITNTHVLFHSYEFFLTAALETPQEYFEFRFWRGDVVPPDTGINYIFVPLLILQSGRHLLCARDVGASFVGQARKLGFPLSTLGIIELPFKVG